jgi:hypothetical protein
MTKNRNSDFGFIVFLGIALVILIPMAVHRGDYQTAIRISKIILLSAFGVVITGLIVFLAYKNREKIIAIIEKKEKKGKEASNKEKGKKKNGKLNEINISEENLLWLFDEEVGREQQEREDERRNEDGWLPPEPFRFAKIEEKKEERVATETTTEEQIDRILDEIAFE